MKTIPIDQIFVTWTQCWNLNQYIEHYVRTRRLPVRTETLDVIRATLETYRGNTPYTKSDLDFFLDANLGRTRRTAYLEIPQAID